MSEREPLTLEELRGMDGKLVWCEPLKDWAKVFKFGIMFFGTEDGCTWKEITETYGKDWLAYADELPRIDRSAWEPCEFCGYAEYPDKALHPKEGYLFYAGFSKQRGVDSFCEGETEEINFCPICCRPLTDAAWGMLERRLAGSENQ